MHRTPVPLARAEAIVAAMAALPTESRNLKDGPDARASTQNSDSEFPEEKSHHQFDHTPLSLRRSSPLVLGLSANIPRQSLASLRLVASKEDDNISLSDLSRTISISGQKTSYNIGAGSSTVEVHNYHASPADTGSSRPSGIAALATSTLLSGDREAPLKRRSREAVTTEATAAGGVARSPTLNAAASSHPNTGSVDRFILYIFYVFWTQRWFYDCNLTLSGGEMDINNIAGSLIKNLDTHFGTCVKSVLAEPLEEMTLIYALRFLRYRCAVCREYGGGLAACLTRTGHPASVVVPSAAAAIHMWDKGRTSSPNASVKTPGVTENRADRETDYEAANPRPVHVPAMPAVPLTMTQILQQQTKIPLPSTVILPLLHRST